MNLNEHLNDSLTLSAAQQHEQQREKQDLHVVSWYVDKPPAPPLLYCHSTYQATNETSTSLCLWFQ